MARQRSGAKDARAERRGIIVWKIFARFMQVFCSILVTKIMARAKL
jgi:hypothetical protein